MSTFDFRDEFLFDIHRKVEELGFAIQYVLGEGPKPPWGYSIGFLRHGHPEVVVCGLDPESTAHELHYLYDEIVAGVHRPVGRDHEQELGQPPLPVRLLPVPRHHWDWSGDRLCTAVDYYRSLEWDRSQLRALQLVWATPSGHFPWDPQCSKRFRRLQPLLAREPRRAA